MGDENVQKQKVRNFFNEDEYWQGNIYKEEQKDHFSRLVARRKEYTMEMLQPVLGESVSDILDIGCGAGIYMKEFVQRGYHVVGIDTSEGMLERVNEALDKLDNWELILGDIEDIPIDDAKMDIVVCMGVLPYLLKDQKALSELHRVIRKDGHLIISATNWLSINHYHTLVKMKLSKLFGRGTQIEEYQPGISYTSPWFLQNSPTKYRFKAYNPWKFEALMDEMGFKRIDAMSYGFEFPLIRKFHLLPPSLLDKLEIALEKFLKKVPVPILSFSGFEYIGLFQKDFKIKK